MKLHEAVKHIVVQFGRDIVKDVRLANILDDFNAYEEVPAAKTVLKAFLQGHFGDGLLIECDEPKRKSVVAAFSSKHGFQDELVRYVVDCLCFGIDKLKTVSPYDAESTPVRKAPTVYDFSNLQQLFATLKTEYTTLLNKSLVTPKRGDVFTRSGYIPAKAEVELRLIANKLQIVGNAIGQDVKVWLKQTRDSAMAKIFVSKDKQIEEIDIFLAPHKQSYTALAEQFVPDYFTDEEKKELKKKAREICEIASEHGVDLSVWCEEEKDRVLKAHVEKLKRKYTSLAESLVTKPRKTWAYTKSGYYDESALQQLSKERDELDSHSQDVGENLGAWCDQENERVLSQYIIPAKKKYTQIFTRIGIPAILLAAVGGGVADYQAQKPYREAYEQQIALGEKNLTSGDYVAAVKELNAAEGMYSRADAGEINDKVHGVVDKLDADITSKLSSADLAGAVALIAQLDALPLSAEQEQYRTTVKSALQAPIESEIEKAKNTLVTVIYSNGGKLTPEGNEILDNALKLSPKDYWLNFIKNKQ